MADRKQNLAALFNNTRSRTIIIFTVALVILAISIGLIKLLGGEDDTDNKNSSLTGVPGISSIPGQLSPTEQYAKLQAEQNVSKAVEAKKTGESAIPTLIRTEQFGQGDLGDVSDGIGFSTLARKDLETGAQKPWLLALKDNNCPKEQVDQAQKEGATLQDLLSGCSCAQLKNHGFALAQLKEVCPCHRLRAAGVSAKELKIVGLSARELRLCGFSACELKAAGFSAAELKAAGFSDGELQGGGFSLAEIKLASGLPDGISADDIRAAGCDVAALRNLRARGVSAAAIRRISGCSAAALRAAGFTAQELKEAGFSAAELREAGFSAKELKDAGFSLDELRKAGFSAADLKAVGFSAKELKDAGFTAAELLEAGFDEEALRDAGFSEEAIANAKRAIKDCSVASLRKARAEGMSAKDIREQRGCSAKALKDAGFTAAELRAAGFSAKELKDAGFSAAELKEAGFSAAELREAGFSAAELKAAGFSAKDLKDAGFTAAELKAAGFSAAELREAGFDANALKDAGFSLQELKDAGFSARELMAAGFSAKELKDAGFSPEALRQAGFSVEELKNAGFTAEELKAAGFFDKDLGQGDTTDPKKPETDDLITPLVKDPAIRQALQQQKKRQDLRKTEQQINIYKSQMRSAANRLYMGWKPQEQRFVVGQQEKEGQEGLAPGVNGLGNQATTNQPPALIKAGTIYYAVLETTVNSDEPSPILARIVQGPLKGARVVGQFTRPAEGQRVIMTFNLLSIPKADHTMQIDAVAIDMNTTRTAIASRVDNHTFQRYSSLFASSFLEGFGNAFMSNGSQVTSDGFSIEVRQAERSLGENIIAAMAEVGKRWGDAIGQGFNKPPTVHVNSGLGIGLLFMSDLVPRS